MKTASGDCLLTNISNEQIAKLEQIFAVMTPKGWAVPEWLLNISMSQLGEKLEIVEFPE